MRKILLLIVLFGATITGLRAQVGIGTKKPNAAAQLEVKSDPDKKGILIPRIELTAIDMPLAGLAKEKMPNSVLVFNTKKDLMDGAKKYGVGYYYWATNDGSDEGDGKWVPLLSGDANVVNNFFKNFNTKSSTVVYNETDNTLKVNVGNGLKEYVDAVTKETYVGLGGDLKEDTTIKFTTKKLKLEGVPKTDVLDDKILVWNEGTKEFKYSDGINAGQISSADPAGGGNVNEGKILTAGKDGKVVWTTIDASNTKTVNFTEAAGDGLTYNSNTGKLSVNAGNGLSVDSTADRVELGGALEKATVITADDTKTLAIQGLKKVETGTDNIVVVDPSTGILRKVEGVKATQISAKDASGNADANKGKILTVNDSGEVVWTTIDASNTKTIDLSKVAGDGLTYSSTTGKLDIGAGNGITVTSNTVEWGGELTKTATIQTADKKGFEIKPKDPSDKSNVVIEKLPEGKPGDNLVVVDSNGKLKQISPLDAATINYSSDIQTTGRKWTLPASGGGSQELVIKEVTFAVTFDNSSTVEIYNEIQGKPNSGLTAMNQLVPVSIRAIQDPNSLPPLVTDISVSQSGSYNTTTGELTLGMSGNGFTVAHNGKYFIVLEYYVKP